MWIYTYSHLIQVIMRVTMELLVMRAMHGDVIVDDVIEVSIVTVAGYVLM